MLNAPNKFANENAIEIIEYYTEKRSSALRKKDQNLREC